MDCTYKTNKYKLPLFHTVGVTPWNTTFTSSYCFIAHEKTEDYIWALRAMNEAIQIETKPQVIITDNEDGLTKAIASVFPDTKHQLCLWQ